MFIDLHRAAYRNEAISINIRKIKGQVIPIKEGIFNAIVNMSGTSFKVTETKSEIMNLIKEARKKHG